MRHYMPGIGRFVSRVHLHQAVAMGRTTYQELRDVWGVNIGPPGTPQAFVRNGVPEHPYTYGENRPTVMVDPSGLFVAPVYPIPPTCLPGTVPIYPSGVGPSKKTCDPYRCGCGRAGRALYEICMRAGDDPWADCVRKCLLGRWLPAPKCRYKGGITDAHKDCWFDVCKPTCEPITA